MIFGFASSLILIFAIAFHNWKRAQVSEVQELIPNCLLTSYPLVFITGRRSLFYFLAYWNEIPHWLASHGYEVFHLQLPWKNERRRSQVLENFLKEKSQSREKFHLFVDESSLALISALLEKSDYECLTSVTLIGHSVKMKPTLTPRLSMAIEEVELPSVQQERLPIFWFLHQIWTLQKTPLTQLGWKMDHNQGQVLLHRAQFLAERDLLQKQRSPNLKG